MKYLLTIFLFLTMSVSAKALVTGQEIYYVCKDTNTLLLGECVEGWLKMGYKTLSGVHAVQTPKGTLFFQAVIKN